MEKTTLCALQLQRHINDLHQFKYGTVEKKKPRNLNLRQGFGR